ncbi:hypothetical protein CEXT_706781 [Caerostris extrusa]|uniref:Uncharacterized protein n=1 Tax=Caerostris extrusa TaxID=172846 RepID=A0AAV4PY92_CAEEX|nr:hypothetical protein CEXT_706781 [Caerostris extrusa]
MTVRRTSVTTQMISLHNQPAQFSEESKKGQRSAQSGVVVARVHAPLSQGSRTAGDLGVSYEGRGENPGVIGRERESIYIGDAVTHAIATPRKQA